MASRPPFFEPIAFDAGDIRAGIALGAIALLSLLFHNALWPVLPPDFPLYQLPWFEHLRVEGPVGAFAAPFSNYSPPYLYLLALASLTASWLSPFDAIKLLSVASGCWMGFCGFRLARAAGAREPVLAGACVLLLPTVVVNGAMLGQCDALWVAPLLLALAAMLEERPRAMLVWVGIAFAFKAQAAFLAPFVFAWLLHRKAPPQWWLIPVASYLALLLPAWIAGWPLSHLLTVYLRQSQDLGQFISNAASLWSFGAVLAPDATRALIPLGLVVAGSACFALIGILKSWLASPRQILAAAVFCALFVPFVLPKMHERYTFLADVLALLLAFAIRHPRPLVIAALVQSASLAASASYIFDLTLLLLVGAAAAGAALILIAAFVRRSGPDPRPV